MTIGYSIFRRTRNGKQAKRWMIRLRLANGSRRDEIGFTDKAATQQKAARLVRELERKEVGLHDRFASARKQAIDVHLDAFLLAMTNGSLARRRRSKPTAGYVKRVRKRLAFLFRLLGVSRLEHLVQEDAERTLADRVAAGWSDKTRDDHASLLRQFGSWLVDAGRWQANPFHRLRQTRNDASPTFRRHALTVAELEQLVEAAEVRGVQEYARSNPSASPATLGEIRARGEQRAAFYQIAAYTGLRRGELCALAWGDVSLGKEPSIDVRAATQKTKRRVRLEVPAWAGGLLERIRAVRAKALGGPPPAGERVFLEVSYRHVTEQLRLDAVFAKLGRVDEASGKVLTDAGRAIDLHALRGTLATLAAEVGMPVKLLQEHLRHSDIRITMGVYAQVRSRAMRAELERLPAPWSGHQPPPGPPNTPPALPGDVLPSPTGDERRGVGT